MRPDELVDAYLAAVSSLDHDAWDDLVHREYVFREWPNAINPRGSERDRQTSLNSLVHAGSLLEFQHFEVHEHLVDGDTVASRMTWRGRLAADAGPLRRGMDLTAHISQHTTLRDGRIWRTESFDCYEPF